jgi:hypothetical protein
VIVVKETRAAGDSGLPRAVLVPEPAVPLQRTGPSQRADTLLEHAVRYAEERHWDVLPGCWLVPDRGALHCSCADSRCQTPGAHPTGPDWADRATGSATVVRRLWTAEPRASVLLPTGRTFDVIDVPESAGCLALARMERTGTTLGPVGSAPGKRMFFFVMPGAAVKAPGLVRRLGWALSGLGLHTHGEHGYVPAPPTQVGTRGSVQWVRHPTAANRWLPDADELLPSLAYACAQSGG